MLRLCLQFGCTQAELGARMTSSEFSEFVHLWNQEPWGDKRGDIHAAQISSAVINFAGKQAKKDVQLTDVLLFADRQAQAEADDPAEFFAQYKHA